jgi:hypothetical protein
VAAVDGGGIYVSQTTPTPVLNITATDSELVLSWVVPSMTFVLQESRDLMTAQWSNAPTPLTLNCSNLQHQVILSSQPGARIELSLSDFLIPVRC